MTEQQRELKEWMRLNPEKHITREQMGELVLVYSDDTNNMVEGMIEFFDCAGQSTWGAYNAIGMSEEEAIKMCTKLEEQYNVDFRLFLVE